jgi:hypothetical protein
MYREEWGGDRRTKRIRCDIVEGGREREKNQKKKREKERESEDREGDKKERGGIRHTLSR